MMSSIDASLFHMILIMDRFLKIKVSSALFKAKQCQCIHCLVLMIKFGKSEKIKLFWTIRFS
jgi:hypothetical protein